MCRLTGLHLIDLALSSRKGPVNPSGLDKLLEGSPKLALSGTQIGSFWGPELCPFRAQVFMETQRPGVRVLSGLLAKGSLVGAAPSVQAYIVTRCDSTPHKH